MKLPFEHERVRDGRGGLVAASVGRENRVFESAGAGADRQLADEIAYVRAGG